MLTDADRALLRNLEDAPQELRNVITTAATAARRAVQDAGHPVRFDDRHAALDAAVYRYMLASSRND